MARTTIIPVPEVDTRASHRPRWPSRRRRRWGQLRGGAAVVAAVAVAGVLAPAVEPDPVGLALDRDGIEAAVVLAECSSIRRVTVSAHDADGGNVVTWQVEARSPVRTDAVPIRALGPPGFDVVVPGGLPLDGRLVEVTVTTATGERHTTVAPHVLAPGRVVTSDGSYPRAVFTQRPCEPDGRAHPARAEE